MIDIHSHILPGVDDGAQTVEDALKMLLLAAADGVTVQYLTPHIQPNRFNNNRQALEERFSVFREQVANAGITIELRLAAEVHIGPEVMTMVDRGTLPWLGRWRGEYCFLLELPSNTLPTGSINLIHWLRKRQITPIIVHPERNREFQKQPDKLRPFIEAGCPLQITSGSLSSRFGPEAQVLAEQLLKGRYVSAIATDSHNLAYRPPCLSEGFKMAANILNEGELQHLATLPLLSPLEEEYGVVEQLLTNPS
ncbi:MAG: protein-tyrosine phosphatase [Halothiobacillaceae bacterium]|nr:MAG: protein-tyrosine phosphatase [Halothiobacillaceae bacterium]